MHDISIIIPAFNEEDIISNTIERVVEYFKKLGIKFELIIVDDGSTDYTGEIVRENMSKFPMVRLIENGQNHGKGFSIKQGVLTSDGEWILYLDADLSTAPEEFEKFKFLMGDYDIIIGSRMVMGAHLIRRQNLAREFAGRFFNKIVRFYLGLPFADTQCGFKLFSRKTKIIFEKQTITRWVFDVELLYLAKKLGFKIKEIGVSWINDPTSTVKFGDFISIFRDLRTVKRTWSSLKQLS